MTTTDDLIGEWQKSAHPPCAALYPDHISFKQNSIYEGRADVPGAFALWDAGSYELAGNDELKISTATDAIKSYRFALVDDVMSLMDESNCSFAYQRISS
ncbi:MAG: hypothetical protein ACR2P3_04765 [Geminicoccaceae bacterium]